MIMPQYAFDTLEYAKELEEAGMEPKIAEAQAKAQVKILSNLLDYKVATKDDLKELKGEIKDLGIKVNSRIDQLDSKIDQLDAKFESKIDQLDSKINQLDAKFEFKIDQLDAKFESKFEYFNSKMDSLEHKLTTKLGKMMVASVGFMAALFTVFHFL
jgi:chromosome segregation ATPase